MVLVVLMMVLVTLGILEVVVLLKPSWKHAVVEQTAMSEPRCE